MSLLSVICANFEQFVLSMLAICSLQVCLEFVQICMVTGHLKKLFAN